MRIKIGDKLLSEETSKNLLEQMKEEFGEITYDKAQLILASSEPLDIQVDEDNITLNNGYQNLHIPVAKSYYIAQKQDLGWKKLYTLYCNKDSFIYQKIDKPSFSFDKNLIEMKNKYQEFQRVEEEIKGLKAKSDELYFQYINMRDEIKEKLRKEYNIN